MVLHAAMVDKIVAMMSLGAALVVLSTAIMVLGATFVGGTKFSKGDDS